MNRPTTCAGDDVGGLAAGGDHAVDLVTGRELLAQEAEGDLGDHHRVPCVDPLPGRGRRVRGATGEGHVEVGDGETGRLEAVLGPGVDHHGRVDVLEHARARA